MRSLSRSARLSLALVWLTSLLVAPAGYASHEQGLSGVWVMAQLTTTAARIPIVGDVYATSRLVTLHRLRHQRDRLQGEGQLCNLELHSGSRFVRTTVPRAGQASLPTPVFDARIGADANGRLTLSQERRFVVVGARLTDPRLDPLPHAPSDPAVFDEDRDGQPGMTIEIGGLVSGRIFVAQRSWTELSGRMIDRDRIVGSVRFGNEQVVLRATSMLLAHAPASRAVPERSWFRMTRLADQADCARALATAESWFR